jgi:hypothetical protein
MALKDLVLPGALIAAGAVIIYQYTQSQHAAGKLALAESGGRQLPQPPAPGAAPGAAPAQVPPSGATGAGAGGPGLSGVPTTGRQQARLLLLYRANEITARQYLAAGGDYTALRRAEDEMGDGYMQPQPLYGPTRV